MPRLIYLEVRAEILVPQIFFLCNDLTWSEARSFQKCAMLWFVLVWMFFRILKSWANHWKFFLHSLSMKAWLTWNNGKRGKEIIWKKDNFVFDWNCKMLLLVNSHFETHKKLWIKWFSSSSFENYKMTSCTSILIIMATTYWVMNIRNVTINQLITSIWITDYFTQ